jgi:D-glycero-D-manno-heptose 1,7-bisphosphate phosphatase
MIKLIFLDRDGVLNENREDYVKSFNEMKILPGVKEALKILKENDYKIIVISNQSAVGRGIISEDTVKGINERLNQELDGSIDDFFYCPHKPEDGCSCRKPKTKLILDAAEKYGIDPKGKWLIGDNTSDIELGKNAGCKTILVKTGLGKNTITENKVEPDRIAEDLLSAVKWIVGNER